MTREAPISRRQRLRCLARSEKQQSKQAFEDRRNVEGVIYGGGAFLSALGLGVVAKPISRGLGKVARFFTKRQDAKEMQEFLASDRGPAYTAEPPPDNTAVEYLEDGVTKTKQFKTKQERLAFIDELRSDPKREMINLKIVPKSTNNSIFQ